MADHKVYIGGLCQGQRRFAQGMTIIASYTRSQNMDSAYGTTGNSFSATVAGLQNAYASEQEYGLSSVHSPNRLSMAVTYELPLWKTNRTFGGWSFNAISVMQSGYPLTITQPNDNSVIGASHMRPNGTGLSAVVDKPFAQRLDGWIDAAAFAQAPQFNLGNVSRTNPLRGPGQINWGVSIFKPRKRYSRSL